MAAARRALKRPTGHASPGERSRIVWRLGDLLEQHADEFAEIEALDNGKPITNARRDDVGGSISMFRYTAGWATRLNGETIPVQPGQLARLHPASACRCRRPDHTLEFSAHDGRLEACAGSCCGLHDRSQAGGANAALGAAFRRADRGSRHSRRRQHRDRIRRDGGVALANHPDVDKVAFAGSTEVGKLIVKAAAGNPKRVSLELGGKPPAIVFPDADLDPAIGGVADAIFYNQGQCCTAGSRLFAHKSVYDKIVEGMVERAGEIKVGHGLDPSVQLRAARVKGAARQKVAGYIESGRKEGREGRDRRRRDRQSRAISSSRPC